MTVITRVGSEGDLIDLEPVLGFPFSDVKGKIKNWISEEHTKAI